jgi:stage IV sporulation protein FB
MGWEDRRYEPRDGGTGFRAVLRRIFWNGENFFDWALPLYTAWGIRVKLHLLFILQIIVELVQSISFGGVGIGHKAMAMASLFGLVLLHEYGHCIACRRIGGTANQILLWPLGGLATCMPPRHHWLPNLIVTLGGPAVNLVLWPIFGGVLLLLGVKWNSLFFNPFDPKFAIPTGAASQAMLQVTWWIWWLYYTNAILLLFNMILPMYPMDGARTWQAFLWRSMGYRQATIIMVNVGLFSAVAIGVFAVVSNQGRLLGLALFGGFTCYSEKRRLAMTVGEEHPALAGYDFDRGYQGMPDQDDDRRDKARQKQIKKEQDDQAELDRILAKIAKTGMGSLSKAETKWLARATERRRGGA